MMKKNILERKKMREELNNRIDSGTIDIPELVRFIRKIMGKNQEEYAKMIGLSKKILSDFELDKGNPTADSLKKMLAPFGLKLFVKRISVDDLV